MDRDIALVATLRGLGEPALVEESVQRRRWDTTAHAWVPDEAGEMVYVTRHYEAS